MKKTRRRYDRDFKISVLAELEAGKPLAQIAREYGIHPSLPCRWKAELAENPEKAFRGNGNKYKDQAKIEALKPKRPAKLMPPGSRLIGIKFQAGSL
jgi:transposase